MELALCLAGRVDKSGVHVLLLTAKPHVGSSVVAVQKRSYKLLAYVA